MPTYDNTDEGLLVQETIPNPSVCKRVEFQ